MATLREARLARKAAIERFRYYRKKHNIPATKEEIQSLYPTVTKGLTEEQYEREIQYFKGETGERMKEIIEEYYLEPEDETAPIENSVYFDYWDRLNAIDPMLKDQFVNMIDNVSRFYSGSIEEILSDGGEKYIAEIEETYSRYPDALDVKKMNNLYHHGVAILNKMGEELFGTYFLRGIQ